MIHNSGKLLVICGPTATGKTDLGIYLAKKFNGEIISADSKQVYRGMDIVTGKDILQQSELRIKNLELGIKEKKFTVGYRLKGGIPIWLVDIVDPDYPFNVGEYAKIAQKIIEDIWSRNKLPIIVGGTGLYIKSIIQPLPLTQIPPNNKLREKLNILSREELTEKLKSIDIDKWNMMNSSDRLNPRRLIRAIEIRLQMQKSKIKIQNDNLKFKSKNILLIGLLISNKKLYERIDKRVDSRLKEGAVNELNKLLAIYSWNSIAFSSIGYKQLKDYVDGKDSLYHTIRKWKLAEHAYARRQLTWFKKALKMSKGKWFDITKPDYIGKIAETTQKWYTHY